MENILYNYIKRNGDRIGAQFNVCGVSCYTIFETLDRPKTITFKKTSRNELYFEKRPFVFVKITNFDMALYYKTPVIADNTFPASNFISIR